MKNSLHLHFDQLNELELQNTHKTHTLKQHSKLQIRVRFKFQNNVLVKMCAVKFPCTNQSG